MLQQYWNELLNFMYSAHVKIQPSWIHPNSPLSASQLDVLDRRRSWWQSDDREVMDGWVRKKLSDCSHCSVCPRPHGRCGCQEAVLDQRLQEGELRKEPQAVSIFQKLLSEALLHLILRTWVNTGWRNHSTYFVNYLLSFIQWTWTYFVQSIETVKVDGTGHYSFTGLFNRRPALGLAVFESSFYWVDEKGLWQVPQNQLNQREFIWKAAMPILAVYHELQQPQGTYWNNGFNATCFLNTMFYPLNFRWCLRLWVLFICKVYLLFPWGVLCELI